MATSDVSLMVSLFSQLGKRRASVHLLYLHLAAVGPGVKMEDAVLVRDVGADAVPGGDDPRAAVRRLGPRDVDGEPVLIEANPRYWQTVLGSLAMGINFPDLHFRLALGGPPAVPKSRTGFYLDTHSLLVSPSNVVALIRRDPGFLRYIDRSLMVADPRLDIAIVWRTLQRTLAKTVSRVKGVISSMTGGPGASN